MAGNTIKGLTVEIGGDTTKLGKALENVNKKSKDLSSELGQINRLLKMDPGNADLLAQKQKVLAEAVSNTKDKLETLKKAEQQVQEQFKRGEVSEAQVRELQREIIATEKKMDSYAKAAKETADAIDQLGDGSDDVVDGTKKTSKGADDAADSLDDLADSADKADKASDGLGKKLGGALKTGLAAVATAATAAVGAMVGAAEGTREYRTAMGKLDTAFTQNGHTTEAATATYKELQGVLGDTDQAVEASNHLAKLTDNEKDLATWSGDILPGVFATFGDSLPIEGLTEAANETAKVGQVTGPLADALNWAGVSEDKFNESLAACSSEQERQALITETLAGLYGDASAAYKETNAEVIRANEANEAWTASMAEVGGAVEPILTDVKMLGASLLSDLLPGVKGVAEGFRGILNGDEGAAAGLGEALSGLITQLLTKVTELIPAVAQVAVSLITTLATTLLQQLPTIVTTLLQVVTQAINTLATSIPTLLPAILAAFFGIVDALLMNLPTMVEALMAVVNGIIAALPQMLGLLCDRIPEIIIELLYNAVPALLEASFQMLTAIVQAIPMIIEALVPMIPTIVDCIIGGLLENIPVLLDGALKLLNAIVQAIPLLIQTLVTELPNIIDTILASVVDAVPLLLDAAIQLLFAILDAIPVLLDSLIPALPVIIDTIVGAVIKALPVLLNAAVQLLLAIVQAIPKILPPLIQQLPTIISTIIGTLLKNLPLLINAAIKLFHGIVEAIPKIIVELAKQLPSIIKAIVKGLGQGVKNVAQVGTDLIKGLWNGIKDMTGWILGKIKGFGESVLGGIKSFFGIKSPSRVFRDQIGKNLALGMAEGIEDNADAPLDAMEAMGDDLLNEAEGINGLTLERQLRHTFGGPAASAAETGMLARLDKILAAIENGQILTIDGDTLVGATLDRIDQKLGQRRKLTARGAL